MTRQARRQAVAMMGMALLGAVGTAASAATPTPVAPAASAELGFPDQHTPEAAVYRGTIVFNHYCVLCHGVKADGNGRAAKLYTPRPANLVLSDKNDEYKELIIRQGGKMLGRSEFMPSWSKELTDEQVKDVVAFLHSVRAPRTAGK